MSKPAAHHRCLIAATIAIPLAGLTQCTLLHKASSRILPEPHSSSIHEESTPPNIILFLVDDMGWQDTSLPFSRTLTDNNRKYHTPNMVRLAQRGVTFTSAYASAVSSPTRTSLMTGMNAARHRVTNWTLHYNRPTDHHNPNLTPPEWAVNGLQPPHAQIPRSVQANTLPELLKAHGYYTIHCGKAHWGSKSTPGANPQNLGFDINIAGSEIGGLASYHASENFGKGDFHIRGLEKYHGTSTFVTEALTTEALEAIKIPIQHKQPFYLYLSHYAVHVPLDRDPRFFEKYLARGLDPQEAAYAALIEGMDHSLGQVLDFVDSVGIAQNTIILFMSDNGGLSHHGRGGGPQMRNRHNAPLRSGKGSTYEGGIRVPLIVAMPDQQRKEQRESSPVIIEDLFPTILEMASVKGYQTLQSTDGKSFLPILQGEDPSPLPRELYFHYPNNWIPEDIPNGIAAYSTIIRDEWKLIHFYRTGHQELYDLHNDLSEERDLADKEPDIRKDLAHRLSEYLRSVSAQRPTNPLKGGKPYPWPDGQP